MVGRCLANVNYITLVNLMAAEKPFQDSSDLKQGPGVYADQDIPFPEYLTRRDCSRQLADHVIGWLEDETSHASKRLQLGELKEKFAHPGATERAAEFILAQLQDRQDDQQVSRAA